MITVNFAIDAKCDQKNYALGWVYEVLNDLWPTFGKYTWSSRDGKFVSRPVYLNDLDTKSRSKVIKYFMYPNQGIVFDQ